MADCSDMAHGPYPTGTIALPQWQLRSVTKPVRGSSTVLRSRCLLLQILFPLPARGQAVHHGAVGEGALGGGDVLGLAGPGLLRRCLERAAIAKCQSPRQAAVTDEGNCRYVRQFVVT